MIAASSLVFAWPSSGRRACLAKSLAGFAANARLHGEEARFLVSTDLDRAELDPGLAAGLEAARGQGELELSDRRSRLGLIERLGADFDPELLNYALFPHPDGVGWGCNVNASMLASAGSLLVSCDDDVFCEPARRGGASPDLLYSDDFLVTEPYWFRNRGELRAAVSPAEIDVAGCYRAFLGKTRRELFGADDGELSTARSGPGSPVLVASPGTYGDSAMGSARSILGLEGEARDFAMSNYEEVRLSREVLRMAPWPTLSPSSQLIMAQTGFDNRLPLPPFLTYGRNPDGLFAVLLRLVYPGSLTAYFDFGFLHDPPEARAATRRDLVGFRPGLAELVMAAAIDARPDCAAADPAARFARLGSALLDLASLTDRDFAAAVHEDWARGTEPYLARLEALLDCHGREPASWAADVDEHIGAVGAALRDPESAFGERGCGLAAEAARKHFALYGRLLGVWPDLHAACAALGGVAGA